MSRRNVPGHHERSKVCHVQLALHVDGRVDDETDEGEEEAESDERKAQTRVIAGKGQDQQHYRARHVGGHGVQIRLDRVISEPRDDLRQEELRRLQRHPEADFDAQDHPARWVLEDLE